MATYHVANAGSDSAGDGSQGSPWETYSHAISESAEDYEILGNGGDVFREQLALTSPRALGAYGTGRPSIKASDDYSGDGETFQWTDTGSGTNEWFLEEFGGGDPGIDEPGAVWLDGTRLIKDAGGAGALADHTWDWATQGSGFDTIVLRDDSGDPDTTGVLIEGAQRFFCIDAFDVAGLTIEDTDFFHAKLHNIQVLNGPGGHTFRTLRIAHALGAGLTVREDNGDIRTDILCEDLEIDHCGSIGLTFTSWTRNSLIRRVEAHHNGWDLGAGDVGGIRLVNAPTAPDAQSSYGIIIEFCHAHHNGVDDDDVTVFRGATGIWADTMGDNGGADPCILRYNLADTNAGSAIFIENCKGLFEYGNIGIGSIERYGLRVESSLADFPNEDCQCWNSTYYGNFINIFCAGVYQETGADTFNNNTLRNLAAGGAVEEELKVINGAPNTDDANGRGTGNSYLGLALGVEHAGMFEWNNGNHLDTYAAWYEAYSDADPANGGQTVEGDQQFVDAAGGDLRLRPTSPCRDRGFAPWGGRADVSKDADGLPVPQGHAPDIGAHELRPALAAGATGLGP